MEGLGQRARAAATSCSSVPPRETLRELGTGPQAESASRVRQRSSWKTRGMSWLPRPFHLQSRSCRRRDAVGDVAVARFVAENFGGVVDVGFGVVLEEGVGIFEIIGVEFCAHRVIEAGDDFVERMGLAAADVEDGGLGRVVDFHGQEIGLDDILDGDKVAFLVAGSKDAGAFAGLHLKTELPDHAGEFVFVAFARAIDVEIAEADDGEAGMFLGPEVGEAFHGELGVAVDVERGGGVGHFVGRGEVAVDRGTGGPDDACTPACGPAEDVAEAFDVVLHHVELVGDGGVGDGGLVKDDVAVGAGLAAVAAAGDDIAFEAGNEGCGSRRRRSCRG